MFVAAVPCRLVGIVPVEGGFVNVGVCVDRLAVGVEARNEQLPLGKNKFHRGGLPVPGGCVRRQGDLGVLVVGLEGVFPG